ncbi:hypothetical protein H696_00190 [Fonticula alba]|uniref:Uncharacterized protein n=1 Tax=Fonticula alba TaxID=691883 RepID=A0A058ZF75_FONAL|nr:hypothetical protein H696_00190 [Fonticula alba]KCV72606.1 hypothetical protein H696_00190 [Fonticula alba]|eukprot:XP_009492307.1 hypothetical protein H696_00190 [Fonticula alba]
MLARRRFAALGIIVLLFLAGAAIMMSFSGSPGLDLGPAFARHPAPATAGDTPPPRYAILIDAGSSGSRLMLYRATFREGERLPRTEIVMAPASAFLEPVATSSPAPTGGGGSPTGIGGQADDLRPVFLKVEPGISSFAGAPARDVEAYLARLLVPALRHIEPEAVSETTIQFMDVRVISGEEEALFGWVAGNYILNALTEVDAVRSTPAGPGADRSPPPGSHTHGNVRHGDGTTMGFLDLGGASTQIAFEVDRDLAKHPGVRLVDLSFGMDPPLEFHIYTASHLGLGANAARDRYMAGLVSAAASRALEADLNPGFDPEWPQARMGNHPHAEVPSGFTVTDACLLRGFSTQDKHGNTFEGAGSLDQCLRTIIQQDLINKGTPCAGATGPGGASLSPRSIAEGHSLAEPGSPSLSELEAMLDGNMHGSSSSSSSTPSSSSSSGLFGRLSSTVSATLHSLQRSATGRHGARNEEADVEEQEAEDTGIRSVAQASGRPDRRTPASGVITSAAERFCRFNGVLHPPFNTGPMSFVAVSEFWYTMYDVFGLSGAYDAGTLFQHTRAYCARHHQDVMADHEAGVFPRADRMRIETECFKSAWVMSLLHDGYGFGRGNAGPGAGADWPWAEASGAHSPANSPLARQHTDSSVYVVNSVAGTEVSWTLGALVLGLAGSFSPAGPGAAGENREVASPGGGMTPASGLLLGAGLSLVVLAGLVALVGRMRRPSLSARRRRYQRPGSGPVPSASLDGGLLSSAGGGGGSFVKMTSLSGGLSPGLSASSSSASSDQASPAVTSPLLMQPMGGAGGLRSGSDFAPHMYPPVTAPGTFALSGGGPTGGQPASQHHPFALAGAVAMPSSGPSSAGTPFESPPLASAGTMASGTGTGAAGHLLLYPLQAAPNGGGPAGGSSAGTTLAGSFPGMGPPASGMMTFPAVGQSHFVPPGPGGRSMSAGGAAMLAGTPPHTFATMGSPNTVGLGGSPVPLGANGPGGSGAPPHHFPPQQYPAYQPPGSGQGGPPGRGRSFS